MDHDWLCVYKDPNGFVITKEREELIQTISRELRKEFSKEPETAAAVAEEAAEDGKLQFETDVLSFEDVADRPYSPFYEPTSVQSDFSIPFVCNEIPTFATCSITAGMLIMVFSIVMSTGLKLISEFADNVYSQKDSLHYLICLGKEYKKLHASLQLFLVEFFRKVESWMNDKYAAIHALLFDVYTRFCLVKRNASDELVNYANLQMIKFYNNINTDTITAVAGKKFFEFFSFLADNLSKSIYLQKVTDLFMPIHQTVAHNCLLAYGRIMQGLSNLIGSF